MSSQSFFPVDRFVLPHHNAYSVAWSLHLVPDACCLFAASAASHCRCCCLFRASKACLLPCCYFCRFVSIACLMLLLPFLPILFPHCCVCCIISSAYVRLLPLCIPDSAAFVILLHHHVCCLSLLMPSHAADSVADLLLMLHHVCCSLLGHAHAENPI